MKVQVNGKVVEFALVPREKHQSNCFIYHELNERGQPISEHSFSFPLEGDLGFLTNGNHYRIGNMVGVPCGCDRCSK